MQISAILAGVSNCWEWCNGTCDHCRTTEDINNNWNAVPGHVGGQEAIPFVADFAGPGYFNDLDMLIVGNMSANFYGGMSALNYTETKAHLALWAVLKSPMLLSCDVRSLTPEVLALLTNDEFLAVFKDPLAQQARRLQTSDGIAPPNVVTGVSFNTCPPNGTAPLDRQRWTLTQQQGQIISLASGRALTLSSCGMDKSGAGTGTALCAAGDAANNSAPPQCRNASCPTASSWNTTSIRAADDDETVPAARAISNSFNGLCLEGILAYYQAVCVNPCDGANPKQQWRWLKDDTLRAYGQCLTEQLAQVTPAPLVDIYAAPLVDGSQVVLLFNKGTATVQGSLPLSQLGWKGNSATARDIWERKDLAPVAAGVFAADVEPHGVVFARLTPT